MTAQINPAEVEFTAIRAQGPGGQNVNKVSCAVHLRFDIANSSLPEAIRERLLALSDQRITQNGVVVLKAQSSRSLEQNKEDALQRLQASRHALGGLACLHRGAVQRPAHDGDDRGGAPVAQVAEWNSAAGKRGFHW